MQKFIFLIKGKVKHFLLSLHLPHDWLCKQYATIGADRSLKGTEPQKHGL